MCGFVFQLPRDIDLLVNHEHFAFAAEWGVSEEAK